MGKLRDTGERVVAGKAIARYVRVSPRKVRLVAGLLRGKSAGEALNILRFTKMPSVVPHLSKVLNSAMANVNRREYAHPEELIIGELRVDGGPYHARYQPRAMGRAALIRRRTSHITVSLIPARR